MSTWRPLYRRELRARHLRPDWLRRLRRVIRQREGRWTMLWDIFN